MSRSDRSFGWPALAASSALFASAFFVRYAAFLRGDYMPWWDGVGWSYADLWIAQAASMAQEGQKAGLNFAAEGLLFVPTMALFLKLFDLHTGMMGWAYFLTVLSALLAPMAAWTVYTATGRMTGSLLAGALVVFDPVLAWFGLNGWSDGMTMFSTGLSFWALVLAARRPTWGRLVFLGLALGSLALGHTTWMWPALFWAAVAWPLLMVRERWFPRCLPAGEPTRPATKIHGWVPLATFGVVMVATAIFLWIVGGSGGHDRSVPLLALDSNNQRALAVSYIPGLKWEDWQPSDTLKAILNGFVPKIPWHVETFITGHIANAIHLYGWLLLATGVATLMVALTRPAGRASSFWGLGGLLVFSLFAIFLERRTDPTVLATLAVVGIIWMYFPVARALMVVTVPMLGLLLLYNGITTQLRHSNIIVFELYLLSGIAVSAAVDVGVRAVGNLPRSWGRACAVGGRWAGAMAMAALVTFGALQTANGLAYQAREERYLAWLGTVIPKDSTLFTSGNVDPWTVHELTGATVFYDIERGGRLVVDGRPYKWDGTASTRFPEARGNLEVLDSLWRDGREVWFYAPGAVDPGRKVQPQFIAEPVYPVFPIVSKQAYPADRSRAGYVLTAP